MKNRVDENRLHKPHASRSELQGNSETILVVDDDRFLLNLCEEALCGYGYKVLPAESGESALEIYRRERENIALVVLDLGMPGMGGEKCLQELCALNRHAKVIIASGYSAQMVGEFPDIPVAPLFLSKPYRLGELLGTVRKMLDG
jgi:DNA-binding NtrC family response regulator